MAVQYYSNCLVLFNNIYQSLRRHNIIKTHPLPIYRSLRPHHHMIKKEPYTKDTQPMARDAPTTHPSRSPTLGGQDGRSLTSNVTPTPS